MKQLIKKLDKIFSQFIRLRDADENGYCTCITCGRVKHWKEVDCGHFIKRQYMSTRFNEMNCHAQCKHCNAFEQGADVKYRAALIKLYGKNEVLKLEWLKGQTIKFTKSELELLIKHYSDKIRDMK